MDTDHLIAWGMIAVVAIFAILNNRKHRRHEQSIVEVHERLAEPSLAVRMEDEGFELVELHVNDRGNELRENARWN